MKKQISVFHMEEEGERGGEKHGMLIIFLMIQHIEKVKVASS